MGQKLTAELEDLLPVMEAEKALEQEYFDRAKEALDAAMARREEPSSGGTPFERRSLAAAAKRRQTLGADEPVAFGRIDLEDAETRYVGKVAIRDASAEVLVYQWQSPAANAFHLATASEPYGVARKRVFDAPGNRVRSFEDTLFQQLAEPYTPLGEFTSESDPLLEDLGRQRDTHMRDIVRTIQAEQNRLIREAKDQLLVIQGGPGTGKTAVALHRVSWLLYNHQDLAPQDVLVVGPNPTFTKYIQKVLPDLGDEAVIQQSLPQLLGGTAAVRAIDDPRAARLKGSATMATILNRALKNRVRVPSSGLHLRRRGSAISAIITESEIKSSLKEIKKGTYNAGRTNLRRALLAVAQSRLPLLGNVDAESLFEPTSVESELDKIWPSLSPQQFVRELFGSKERLRLAGATGSQIQALYRPTRARISDEPWTAADLAVLDFATHIMQGIESQYKHIVVDEAQDLSIMQLKAIRRRSRTGSMTIVGDIAQSTSAYARQDWDQVLSELSSELPAKCETLAVGYRVPKEVFEVASEVLSLAAPSITAPDIMRSVGSAPRWLIAESGALSQKVSAAVQEHSSKGQFVGVVACDHHWPALRKEFKSAGLTWGESQNGGLSHGINLVTPEDSKGLEFDALVVVDPQRILNETQGARLLYVAVTRTTNLLDVVMPEGRVPEVLARFVGMADVDESDRVGGGTPPNGSPHERSTANSEDSAIDEASTRELAVPADPTLAEISDAESGDVESASVQISQREALDDVAEQRGGKEATEALENSVRGALSNPHSEAIAQDLANRIAGELEEETGRTGQRRVVELLIQKLNLQ